MEACTSRGTYRGKRCKSPIVKTNSGRTSRPIVKLYPMEVTSRSDTYVNSNEGPKPNDTAKDRPQREASARAKEKIHKWTHTL